MSEDEAVWTEREFDHHDFRDEDLSRLRTERVVFTECDFSGVDMSESEHVGSAFRNCTFRRTSLLHSMFRHCSFLGSVFTECRMRPIKFVEVDFTLTVLGASDLRGVDLSDCRLREASLVDADLRKAMLRRAYAWLERWLADNKLPPHVSIVTCAAAPSLFYADWTQPIPPDCPRLAALRAELLALPEVARCVDDARPFRPYFPPGAPDRD